jgi:antitoxin ParD1/3/4
MSATHKRTISLPAEQAAFIDAKVSAGDYASASEVVRAGLRALRERDQAIERWLVEEVAPTYDAMMASPESALSLDDAHAAVLAHHRARKSPGDAAQDREDARSAARARKDLQAGTFDGVSLDTLEGSLRQSD